MIKGTKNILRWLFSIEPKGPKVIWEKTGNFYKVAERPTISQYGNVYSFNYSHYNKFHND